MSNFFLQENPTQRNTNRASVDFSQSVQRQQQSMSEFFSRLNPANLQTRYDDDYLKYFTDDTPNRDLMLNRLYASTHLADQLGMDIEDVWQNYDLYAEDYFKQPTEPMSALKSLSTAWEIGNVSYQINSEYAKLRQDPGNPQILARIQELTQSMPEPDPTTRNWLLESAQKAFEVLPGMLKTYEGGIWTGLTAAAAAGAASALTGPLAPATALLTVPLAFGGGFRAGSFQESSNIMAGASYAQMIEDGISHDIAYRASGVAGAIGGAIELINPFEFIPGSAVNRTATGVLTRGISGLQMEALSETAKQSLVSAGREAIQEALAQSVRNKTFARLATNYGADIVSEMSEEFLQDLSSMLAHNAAAYAENNFGENIVPYFTAPDFRENLTRTLIDTFQASLVLGAPKGAFDTGTAVVQNMLINRQSEQVKNNLTNIDTAVIDQMVGQDTEGLQARQDNLETRSEFTNEDGSLQTFYIAERGQDGIITAYSSMEEAAGRAEVAQIGMTPQQALSKIKSEQPGWMGEYIESARNIFVQNQAGDLQQNLAFVYGQKMIDSGWTGPEMQSLVSALDKLNTIADGDILTNRELDVLSRVGIEIQSPNFVPTHIDAKGAVEFATPEDFKASDAKLGILPDGSVLIRDPKVLFPTGVQSIKRNRIPKKGGLVVTENREGTFVALDPETNKPAAQMNYAEQNGIVSFTNLPENPSMAAELIGTFVAQNPGKPIDMAMIPPESLARILSMNPEKKKIQTQIAKDMRQLDILQQQASKMEDAAELQKILDQINELGQEIGNLEQQLDDADAQFLGMETAPSQMTREEVSASLRAKVEDKRITAQELENRLAEIFPSFEQKEILATMAIVELRAEAIGMDRDQYVSQYFLNPIQGTIEDGLNQEYLGAMQMMEDGRALIALGPSANFSTFLHEFAHVMRRQLTPQQMQTALDVLDQKEWNETSEELFARSFEAYLLEGKANTPPELHGIFETIKYYMAKVYASIRNLYVDPKPEMYMLFDELLGLGEGRNFNANGDKSVPQELVQDFPIFQTDLENKNLVAVHNLNERKLRWALDMGGIPMPSFMITKIDSASESFGDISLVLKKDTADPRTNRSTKLFAADAFTPRTPDPTYTLKNYAKARERVSEILSKVSIADWYESDVSALRQGLGDRKIDEIQAITDIALYDLEERDARYSEIFKTYYAIDVLKMDPEKIPYDIINNEGYNAWIEDIRNELTDRRIFAGYTNSGKRRYADYNLENLYKLMKKEGVRGAENTGSMGQMRSLLVDQLKSLTDAKKKSGIIKSKAEMEAYSEMLDQKMDQITSDLDQYYDGRSSYQSPFSVFMDNLMEGLKQKNWKKELKNYGFNFPQEKLDQIQEFLVLLKEAPTEYFEGKILDIQYMHGFVAAIVPQNTSLDLIEKLNYWGIKPYQYTDAESKKNAYLQAAQESKNDILFQTNTPEFKQWFGDSKVVDEDGQPLVVYHATNADFDSFRPSKNGQLGAGIYFTPFNGDAMDYGKNLHSVYVRLENPMVYTSRSDVPIYINSNNLKEMGYDGVILKDDNGISELTAFSPSQIKSVNNQGTWNLNDDRILFQTKERPNIFSSPVVDVYNTLASENEPILLDKENFDKNYDRAYDRAVDVIGSDISKIFDEANPEVLSAETWYHDDINYLRDRIAAEIPQANNDTDWNLIAAIIGITSNGADPNSNMSWAVSIYKYLLRTGNLPLLDDAGKIKPIAVQTSGKIGIVGGPRFNTFTLKLQQFETLYKKFGKEGMAEWLVAEHTGREIVDAIEAKPGHIALGETYNGFDFIGPKTGQFSMALLGYDNLVVKDKWFTRTWNRVMGTPWQSYKTDGEKIGLLDSTEQLEKIAETPRGKGERDLMDKTIRDLATGLSKNLGRNITPSALQALLWYNEQALYRSFGLPVESSSFRGAIDGRQRTLISLGYLEEDGSGRLIRRTNEKQTETSPTADNEGSFLAAQDLAAEIQFTNESLRNLPNADLLFQTASPTDSKEFKTWFRESKVVNEDGSPKVLYHGTDENFESFSTDFFGTATGQANFGDGFYFTDQEDIAKSYGENLKQVYINLQNPATMDTLMLPEVLDAMDDMMGFTTVQEILEGMGYDGIIAQLQDRTEYVAFSPNQIKSIFNNGQWSQDDPRLLFAQDPREAHRSEVQAAVERGEPVPIEVLQEFSGEDWADDHINFMAAMYSEEFNSFDADEMAIDAIDDYKGIDEDTLAHEYELINKDLFEDFDLQSYVSGSKEYDPKKLPKREDLNRAVLERWVTEQGLKELRDHAKKLSQQNIHLSGLGFGGKFFTYAFAKEPNSNHLKHALTEARNNINDFRYAVHSMLEMAGSREDGSAKLMDQLVDKYDPLTMNDREMKRRVDKEEDQRRKKLGISELYDEILMKVKIIKGDIKNSEIQKTYQDVRSQIKEAQKRYEVSQQQIQLTNDKLLETNKKAAELERNIQKYMVEHKKENKELTKELAKVNAQKVKLKEKVKAEHAKINEAKKEMKAQFRELNKAQKMKAYQLKLIGDIKRLGKRKSIDYQYKKIIRHLLDQFDMTVMGPRVRKNFEDERAAILGFLQANPTFNDIGFEKYSQLYIQDFSIAELEGLKNEIQELIAEGAWIYEQKQAEKKLKKERKIVSLQDKLLDQLSKKMEIPRDEALEQVKNEPRGDRKENFWDTLVGAGQESLPAQFVFDHLDGGMDFEGPFQEIFYKEALRFRNERQRMVQQRSEDARQALKDFGITEDELYSFVYQIGKQRLNVEQVISIYTKLQNEKATNALLFGNKFPMQEMKNAIGSLEPKFRLLADWIIDKGYGDHYERMREVFIELENEDLGREEAYTPLLRKSMLGQPLDAQMKEDLLGRNALGPAKAADGFTKGRVEIPKDWQTPIRLGEFTILMEMIDKQEHYIAAAISVKEMNSIMRDPTVQQLLAEIHGPKSPKIVDNWIQRVAQPARQDVLDNQDKIIGKVRKHASISYLAYNMVTPLKQLPSELYYLSEANPLLLMEKTRDLVNPTKRKEMQERMFAYAPILKDRLIEGYLNEIRNLSKDGWEAIQAKIAGPGMYLIQQMDAMAVTAGWNAVFETQLAKGVGSDKAAEVATMVTLRTQPTGDPGDTSQMMQKKGAMGLFTQFGSQLNALWGNMTHLPYALKANAGKKYAVMLTSMFLGSTIMVLLSWKRFPEDEEELVMFMRDIALNMAVANIPAVGSIINQAIAGFDSDLPIAVPFTGTINIVKELSRDEPRIDRVAKMGMETMGMIFGIPSIQPNRIISGIANMNEDPPQEIGDWYAGIKEMIVGREKPKKD